MKHMYQLQLRLQKLGHQTWLGEVKKIIDFAELSHLWQSHPSLSVTKHIRKHLELIYRNSWLAKLNNSVTNPILRTYKLVKLDFSTELYLYINIQKYRVALSRLRLSSHHLAIETGRHAKPIVPVHQRLCTKCNLGVLDDEIHFVTQCAKFQNIRNIMYHTVMPLIPNFDEKNDKDKFILLLTSEDMRVLIALAKYVHTAWT